MKRLTVIDKNFEAWRPQLELSDPVIYKKENICKHNLKQETKPNDFKRNIFTKHMLLLD